MAWRSSGETNSDLIDQLTQHGILKSPNVISCMISTDRKHYCTSNPYSDSPQPIGYQATISAPHMHSLYVVCKAKCFMKKLLKILLVF